MTPSRALALLAACTSLASCAKEDAGKGMARGGKARAFPVETVVVVARPVEYTVGAIGSVAAFEQVQVTARVAGVVEKVRFVEGGDVQKGQPLVEIEPARYQLAVKAAAATRARAEAARADAEAGLARREKASQDSPGLIPGEELETWRTRVRVAAAEVAQATVAEEQAQLNLRDAYVRAPIAGTMQTRTVQTGQYLQPGAVLGTLVRRDPLLVRFDVTAQDATRLATGMPLRFVVRGGAGGAPYTAKISHVAASASESSRMVPITAEVDDPRKADLRPGAFAEVTVPVGSPAPAAVIPQVAVRPSERGFLAFVVDGDVARERVLELGMRTPEGLVEVRAGVAPGEVLVTRGAEALRDGARVQVAKKP